MLTPTTTLLQTIAVHSRYSDYGKVQDCVAAGRQGTASAADITGSPAWLHHNMLSTREIVNGTAIGG